MPKPADVGPKPDKLPLDKMPVDKLADVLPEDSGLFDAVAPPPAPTQTGVTAGWHSATGFEPYLFDADEFVLMGDLTPGGDSYSYGIVPLNDDLYLFGQSYAFYVGGLVGRWDPVTGAWDDLLDPSSTIYFAMYPTVIGEHIYFTSMDDTGDVTVGVIDGATDQVSQLPLPLSGNVSSTQTSNGQLIIQGDFAGGVDIITYDPTATAGQEFNLYSLPNDARVTGNIIGSAGSFAYFVGSGTSSSNLYSLNVQTGEIALAFSGLLGVFGEWPVSYAPGNALLNGDLYMAVEAVDGSSQILRADDVTGSIEVVIATPPEEGTQWSHYFELIDATDENLWYFGQSQSSTADAVVKISADGSIQIFHLNAHIDWGQDLNGTLYLNASVDGVNALYRLNDDGSLTFIRDFDGPDRGYDYVLATVDDHLVAYTDSNLDGIYELWTSATPEVPESWTQISPNDVSVQAFSVLVVLDGDYLI